MWKKKMVFCKLIFHCSIGSCVIVWWLTVLVWCIGIGLWSAKRTYSYSGPFTDPFRAKKLMQAGARLICSCQSSSKKSNHFRLLLAFHNGLIKTALMLRVTRMLWAPLISSCLQGGAAGRGCLSSWSSPGSLALVTWIPSQDMTSDTWVTPWPDCDISSRDDPHFAIIKLSETL